MTTSAGTLKIRQGDVVEMVEKDDPVSPAPSAPQPAAPASFEGKTVAIQLKSSGQVSGRVESFRDGLYTVDAGGSTFQIAQSDIASIAVKA